MKEAMSKSRDVKPVINLVNIETVSLLTSKSMTSLGGRSDGSKVLTADSFKKAGQAGK